MKTAQYLLSRLPFNRSYPGTREAQTKTFYAKIDFSGSGLVNRGTSSYIAELGFDELRDQ